MLKTKDKLFISAFVLTCVLAFVMRFWQLGQLPPTLITDEVALGYNAWSILKTGKDEYGKKFPLALRSFDDYKAPLYSYAIIPAMMLFGKNEFAIRFPSAMGGFLTVFLVYFLVLELTKNKWLSLTSSFLLAISPWHIQYSRVAFDGNFALFWIVLGIWSFLRSRKKGIFLLISALSFGLSLYTYHAPRLISPLLVILLIVLFWKEFLDKKKWIVLSATLGFLLIIPLVGIVRGIEGQLRPWSVSIFSETQPLEIFRERIQRDLILKISFGNIWHNHRFVYSTPFLKSYLFQFRPDYLFMGDPDHHAPDVGLLYLWQIPFLFLGFHYLFQEKHRQSMLFIIFWLVISPLPAAIAKETYSSYRGLPIVLPLQIIIAYGLFHFFVSFRKTSLICNRWLKILTIFLISTSFIYYIHMYYVHLPYELPLHWTNGGPWNYGGTETVQETLKLENTYKRVIVSTNLDEIYIYFLFYTNYDPQTYINEGGTISGGFNEMNNHFSKYEFHKFNTCQNPKIYENTLLIWQSGELQHYTKVLKTINAPNGNPVINIGVIDLTGGILKNIKCN